jgi:fructose-1,6-bisphosphatase-3
MDLPTVDPADPTRLSPEEEGIIQGLTHCFVKSVALQPHARFLLSKGSVYLSYNGNLLFHASVPMNADGTFREVVLDGKRLSGEALLVEVDRLARENYYHGGDFLWYLWCWPESPLFGNDKMATFELYFIDKPTTHTEIFAPYFILVDLRDIAEKVLLEFGLVPGTAHTINGHVPVRSKKGENPVKAGGKVITIDGGFPRRTMRRRVLRGRPSYTIPMDLC